jgi:hypothetical protein
LNSFITHFFLRNGDKNSFSRFLSPTFDQEKVINKGFFILYHPVMLQNSQKLGDKETISQDLSPRLVAEGLRNG